MLGRSLGSIAAGFWVLAGVLSVLFEGSPWSWESTVLIILIILTALAVIVAWLRERLGGVLVLLAGIAHAVFAFTVSGHNRVFAVAITGLHFIRSGVFF